jgi:hypothetical protein
VAVDATELRETRDGYVFTSAHRFGDDLDEGSDDLVRFPARQLVPFGERV